ncbi:hypothetical protein [Oceanidesulfovibrio marinus]|uniref:hypothetical protein n=1 Tax=Oceanidesulfovibrio marinus TaxID=370038 RepID=UPI0011833C8B|nr:hypothetical protein [Oceanidesulfovibrio marinus]
MKLKPIVDSLDAKLKKCLEYEQQSIISESFSGPKVENIHHDLDDIFVLLHDLDGLPIRHLPNNIAQEFLSILTSLENAFDKINSFKKESDTLEIYIKNVNNHLESIKTKYDFFSLWILYLVYRKEGITSLVNETQQFVNKKTKEINSLLAISKDIAIKAGIANHSDDFMEESKANKKNSRSWLIASSMFALASLSFLLYLYFCESQVPTSYLDLLQHSILRVLILSTLLSATFWCAKNYRALINLHHLNKHRANALLTFQAFIKATSDEATKNAVLLETTRSIFAVAPSGFLDGNAGASQSDINILQHLQRVVSTTSPEG